jgi:hypothetical protein
MLFSLFLSLWACQSNEPTPKSQKTWVKFQSFSISSTCVGKNAEPTNQYQQRFKKMQKNIQTCFSNPPEAFSYHVSIENGTPKSTTFTDPRVEKSTRGACIQKQSMAWSFHKNCTNILKVEIVPIKE